MDLSPERSNDQNEANNFQVTESEVGVSVRER